MNKIKSVFVMVFMVVMVAITIVSIFAMINGGSILGYGGALLTSVPFLVFISNVMTRKRTARTSANLPVITTLAVIVNYVSGSGDTQPLVLALVGAGAFFGYNFWYSNLGRTPSPVLTLGAQLPAFSIEDTNGNVVESSSFATHPTIMLFYRGNWCPLCMAQIKEIASDYQRLSDLGAKVVLISPQPHGHSAKLAEDFDVPFEFLVDAGNVAANQLGIAMKDGLPMGMAMQGYDSDTVLPTVVITDASGKIIFLDQTDNYRVRPEPSTFIAALEQAGVAAHAAE